MAGPPWPVGLVAAQGAFLLTVAGDDGRVDIQGDALQRTDLAEEPALGFGLYPSVGQHVEAAEQAHDDFVAGGLRPAKQGQQRAVHAHRLRVCKAVGVAPDRDDELLDQLQRGLAPVRPRLGQTPARRSVSESQAVEHLLEQRQPAPCSDLAVAESDREPFPLKH